MADVPDFQTEATPNLVTMIDYLLEGLVDPARLGQIYKILSQSQIDGIITAFGAQKKALETRDANQSSIIDKVETGAEGAVAWALAHLVAHLLGIDVPPSELRQAGGIDGGSPIGLAIGNVFMSALKPPDGDLQPGDAGAVRLLSELSSFTLKSWFEGVLLEYTESLGGIIHPIEHAGELGRELIDAMGFGRLARTGLRPLAHIGIAMPLEWKLHKQYRPTLLAPASVIRQGFRGKWDWADVLEVLARLGYSDASINALINENQKFLATEDLSTLVWLELLTLDEATQTLQDQGWDVQTASKHFNVQKIKHEDAIHRELATAAITAYVDRRLDDGGLSDTLAVAITGAHERELLTTVARGRRALNTKPLSAAQVADCVKIGILGFTDYRDALTREGYSDADGAALELLLRHTVDSKAALDHLKAQQADDRAAAAAARADAAAKKEADAAARALLAKRGSIADNKAAVVRGLIPMARYQEILAAHYDADTVTAMVGLAEQARQDYLDAQAKRDDAAKRAADKGLNVGQLEAAVTAGVLTLDQFRAGAERAGVAPADVDILVATLQAKLADRAAAETKRAEAAAKAALKHPTLATIEALVRAGHRTLGDYDAFLAGLGYDDAGRAAIEELLQTKIDADAKAAATRAAALAADKPRGLSLDQFRRGVILGVKSIADYTSFLVQQKFTTDAISVLVADARDAVAQAAAVQQRRDAVKPRAGSPRLPLAAYTKAARLGLITIDAYRAHLTAIGYADDEAALDVDELLVEIADTQAKRAAGGADASTVTADVSATLAQAQILRAALDAGLKAKQLSTAQLEAAVQDGSLSIDDYVSEAEAVGLGAADAELLGARLASQIAATKNTPAPTSGTVSRAKKKAPPAPA